RPGGGLPGELGDLEVGAGLLGLDLGQAGPGDLRIRVGDGGNALSVKGDVLAGDHLGRDDALVGRLVGEHRVAGDVADRVDVRNVGALPLVDGDDPALVHLHPARPQLEQVPVGAAAGGDEDAVVDLRLGSVLALEADLEALLGRLHGAHLRAEHDRLV